MFKRYLLHVPRKLDPNLIIVHNHVVPSKGMERELGQNGFRAWTDDIAEVEAGKYVRCTCRCWGDLVHYRVRKM
jgi:hypothetical protein